MKRLDLDLLLGLTQDFKRSALTELHLWYMFLMLVMPKNRRFHGLQGQILQIFYRLHTVLLSATNITEQVLFQRLHKRIHGLIYIHFVLALEVVEVFALLLLILLSQGVIIHLHLHFTFLGPRLVMLS